MNLSTRVTGGALKTAEKLVNEAEWTARLRQAFMRNTECEFDPIPIRLGLRMRDRESIMKERALILKIRR